MIINERLANGLKNRFILELHDQIDIQLNEFSIDKNKVTKSRRGWDKFKKKVTNHLSKSSLTIYEGGSERHPYLAFSGLAVDKEREYNSWKEKCVTTVNVITTWDPFHVEVMNSNFNISEHAVSRLYQRGDIKVTNETDIDIFCIVKEFYYVPIWAAFWIQTLYSLNNKELTNNIHPVIPTPSGLLLAEVANGEYPFIEIRTFVGDSELNEEQMLVKKSMVKASEEIIACPLSFSPDVEIMGIDIAIPTLMVLSHRLKDVHRILGNVVFYKMEDKITQREFTFNLLDNLIDLEKMMPKDLSAGYEHPNIRPLHLQIMKVLRKGQVHPAKYFLTKRN